MSEERRRRQQDRQQEAQPNLWIRKLAIFAVLVAVVAGAYLLLRHKQTSRLNTFAQCLTAKGAKMYGAYWCPHCETQKEMFGSSFQYAPYVECGVKGSHTPAQACTDANVNIIRPGYLLMVREWKANIPSSF